MSETHGVEILKLVPPNPNPFHRDSWWTVYFQSGSRPCAYRGNNCSNKGYFWWDYMPPTESQGYCLQCIRTIFRNEREGTVMLLGFKKLLENHPEIALEE